MGKTIPQGVPEIGVLPLGLLSFQIEAVEEMTTSTDKYAIRVSMRVQEPEVVAGMPHFEHFVVGSQDDPQADNDETWIRSFGARNLCTLSKKAGVPFEGDVEELCSTLVGQSVMGLVKERVEPEVKKDGSLNPYAGQVRHVVTTWYAPGSMQPFVEEEGQVEAPKTAPKPPLVPKPVPKAAPKAAPAPAPAKVKMITCSICAKPVPRDTFPQHIEEVHPE